MSLAPSIARPRRADAEPDEGRSAETRRRILDAAVHCFGRHGFRRTRVDEVAERAGVSRALVHGYYGTKSGLLTAVQEDFIGSWSDALARIVAEAAGPREALAAWLRQSLADAERRTLLRALFAGDALDASPDWRTVTEATRSAALARYEELIRTGVDSGVFRADVDVAATAVVLHTLQVALLREFVDSDDLSALARQVDAAVGLVSSGLASDATAAGTTGRDGEKKP